MNKVIGNLKNNYENLITTVEIEIFSFICVMIALIGSTVLQNFLNEIVNTG